MKKIVERFNQNESGAGELINALITIPIILILVFSVFNVGNYFITLGNVSEEVANSARQVAIYGGENSRVAYAKNSNLSIATSLTNSLSSGGSCKLSQCTEIPTDVSCTKWNGGPAGAIKPGDKVSCTITYHYKSFLGGVDFGIGNVLEQPKVITQYSIAETWGYN